MISVYGVGKRPTNVNIVERGCGDIADEIADSVTCSPWKQHLEIRIATQFRDIIPGQRVIVGNVNLPALEGC